MSHPITASPPQPVTAPSSPASAALGLKFEHGPCDQAAFEQAILLQKVETRRETRLKTADAGKGETVAMIGRGERI